MVWYISGASYPTGFLGLESPLPPKLVSELCHAPQSSPCGRFLVAFFRNKAQLAFAAERSLDRLLRLLVNVLRGTAESFHPANAACRTERHCPAHRTLWLRSDAAPRLCSEAAPPGRRRAVPEPLAGQRLAAVPQVFERAGVEPTFRAVGAG